MKGSIQRIPKQIAKAGAAAFLCAAMCVTGMTGMFPVSVKAAPQGVHVYAETPGDVASEKYTLTANGTQVPVIKYDANGNHFDIARFSSDDPAPTFQVTVKEEIQTVNVYPARYYPQENIQISEDKHTVTFAMSAESDLRYALVMINGGPEKQDGKPYLAIINDPTETGQPDAGASNVLNFQTFMEQYLKDHPNSEAEKAEEAGTTSGNVAYEAGQLVENSVSQVRFPNKRKMLENDATLALEAALDEIYKEGSAYDTLYFPAGEYTYSGLEIRNRKGKHVNIYVEEGALLKNRIQECMQAMEPAIGIWDSEDITISGRGIFDGNGVANYKKDRHDAKDSCHQGGVMIVRSSNITFNDTYVRDAKQWNWESHGSKNCTLNNIKGLTPYPQPWVDGLDMASAQNLTINGALTLGNDDCFASGHHNPSDGFPNTVPGFDQYNSDALEWDVEDSFNVSVNNTLGWSNAGGNGIRMGHNTYGHQMKNYSFNNLNAVNFQGGGRGITVQNNTGTYPRYEEITIANCSFDTTRVGTNFEINGKEDDKIQNVRLDNCWFSGEKDSKASNIANLEITNLYVGGKLVEYTSQGKVKLNGGIDSLTYTANGEAVKENTLPVITYPEESLNAYAGNPLVFYVKAEDPDAEDTLVFGDVDLTGLDGAKFDKDTGEFSWTPTEANVGNTYPVTFTVTDCADQPIQRTVRIQVGAADKSVNRYDVAEDAHLATWKDEKTKNTGETKYLTTGRITGKGLMNEGFTNTSTTDTTDGKVIYLKFDLTELKKQENLYDRAELVLTYVNKRKASDTGDNQVRVAVVDDSDWDEKTITWNTKPAYTATEDTTKVSNTFDLGEVALDKPGDKTEPAINGTKVVTDIKDFIDAAINAGKDRLTLVVCETKGVEIYFVSREGAENYKNATLDMAPAILLNIPTAVDIEGPTELTVKEGYPATKTNSFALKGTGNLTVELTCENSDGKITWNEATQQIAIAEGLKAGTYPVTVKVTNSNNESKTAAFTLKVEADKSGLRAVYDSNKDRVETEYTAGSWTVFAEALKAADDVLKKADATQEEVDGAKAALEAAAEGLKALADKTALQEVYDANAKKTDEGYTAASWKTFTDALKAAKVVLDKDDAAQEEADSAKEVLESALAALAIKADGTASVTIAGWQQGNEAAKPVPVSATNGTDNVTYQYKVKGADDSTYMDEVPSAAGEYTLKAIFAATGEYKEVAATVDFVITEAQVPVDKQELQSLYNANQNKEEADYTAESWTEFAKALEAAKGILEKTDAVQEEVDKAKEALQAAAEALVEKTPAPVEADKSKLEACYNENKDKAGDIYTEESWAAFTIALENAKKILEDPDATQLQVNAAVIELNAAAGALKEKDPTPSEADKSALQALYEANQNKAEADHTAESWGAFAKALETAKEILEKESAAQEEVDKAKEALQTAADALEKKEPAPVPADKSELEECYNEHKDKNRDDYTEESFQKFEAALENARTVLEDPDATQEQVDAAAAGLKDAASALEEKAPAPSGADKSALQALYEANRNKAEAEYTAESWSTFAEAMKAAEGILSKADASQEEVDVAAANLQKAADALEKVSVPQEADKTRLQELYDANEGKEQAEYSQESWQTFINAMETAKSVLDRADAVQEEIDAAWQKLMNAVYGLVEKRLSVTIPQDTQDVEVSVGGVGVPENVDVRLAADLVGQDVLTGSQIELEEVDYHAYDVRLLVNDEPVQPNGIIIVAISVPDGYDVNDLNVYHVHNGEKEEKDFAVSEDGRNVLVQTDKLSYFILAKASSVSEPEPALTELKLISPAKLEYVIGEEFDKTGLQVTAVYDDGSEKDVTEEAEISGYDMSREGEQTVTVSYGGQKAEFTITVKKAEDPKEPVLTVLEIIPPTKVEYIVGEEFDKAGLKVTAVYDDGSRKDVTEEAEISGYDMSREGEQTVTASYGGQKAEFKITVKKSGASESGDAKPDGKDPFTGNDGGAGQSGTDSNKNTTSAGTSKAPKTGDTAVLEMYSLISIISLLAVMVIGCSTKRRKEM